MYLSTSSLVMVARSFLKSSDNASGASSFSSSLSAEMGATVDGRWIFPTDETNATTSIPYAILRYFSAMAPAATRPAGNRNQGFACSK